VVVVSWLLPSVPRVISIPPGGRAHHRDRLAAASPGPPRARHALAAAAREAQVRLSSRPPSSALPRPRPPRTSSLAPARRALSPPVPPGAGGGRVSPPGRARRVDGPLPTGPAGRPVCGVFAPPPPLRP